MKRKWLFIVLALVFVLSCSVGLSACKSNCEHRFSIKHDDTYHWQECEYCSDIAHKEAHNTSGANRECSACHYKKDSTENPPEQHTHVWADTLSHDETSHWYACTVAGCAVEHDKKTHSFTNGKCDCGYTSGANIPSEPDTGDDTFKSITVSENGLLSWNKIKGVSKYVLQVVYPQASEPSIYEITKDKTDISLNSIESAAFPAGRSQLTLTAYEVETIELDGDTYEQEVPKDGASDSFRITKLRGEFSLTYLQYTDEYLTLNGFYVDRNAEGDRYVYELPLVENKATAYRLTNYARAKSGTKITYYKSASGRAAQNSQDTYNTTELSMGYPHIPHGETMFYVRAARDGVYKDYDLCVYGLYQLTVNRYNVSYTVSDEGIRSYNNTLISSAVVTERDILPAEDLFKGVESGNACRDGVYNFIPRDDLVVTASGYGATVAYYFYNDSDVRKDVAEYERINKNFTIYEQTSSVTLTLRSDSAAEEITIPYIVFGKVVAGAQIQYNSAVTTVYLDDMFTSFPVSFAECPNITDIWIPSGITYMSDWSFRNVPATATVHCGFSQAAAGSFASKWNYVVGTVFDRYRTVYEDIPPVTIDGVIYARENNWAIVLGVTEDFNGVIPDQIAIGNRGYNITAIRSIDYDGAVSIGGIVQTIEENAFAHAVASVSVAESNGRFVVEDGILYTADKKRIVAAFKTFDGAILPDTLVTIDKYAFTDCEDGVLYTSQYRNIWGDNWDDSAVTFVYGVESVFVDEDLEMKFVIKNESAHLAKYLGTESAVVVPESLQMEGYPFGLHIESVLAGAFRGCTTVTTIKLPYILEVTQLSFDGCPNLIYNEYENGRYLAVDEGIADFGITFDDYNYHYFISPIDINVTSFKMHPNTQVVAFGALAQCKSLTELTYPISARSYRCTYFGALFGADQNGHNADYVPESLHTVNILPGSANGSSNSTIDQGMFYNCKNITDINVVDCNIEMWAFEKCSGLKNFTLIVKEDRRRDPNVSSEIFKGCTSLQTLSIPPFDDVLKIIDLFGAETGVPDTLREITFNTESCSLCSDMFEGCEGVTKLTIAKRASINENALSGCTVTELYYSGTSEELKDWWQYIRNSICVTNIMQIICLDGTVTVEALEAQYN